MFWTGAKLDGFIYPCCYAVEISLNFLLDWIDMDGYVDIVNVFMVV